MFDNDIIFSRIAESLLLEYTSVYYVNIITNEYQWYSASSDFHSLKIQPRGDDFFQDLVRDVKQVIYEKDQHVFLNFFQKQNLLEHLKNGDKDVIIYRLMINGKPVYHSLELIHSVQSEKDDYIVLGIKNIDTEHRRKMESEQHEKERVIFNQIASSLAEHYAIIYYVNIENGNYFEFSSSQDYKNMHIPVSGNDFFEESRKNIRKVVHPDDVERMEALHYREQMIKNLEKTNTFTTTYRMIINNEIMHCRYNEIWGKDKTHIVICIENINKEVAEQNELRKIRQENITYTQIAESLATNYDIIYYINSETGLYQEFISDALLGKLEIKETGLDFFTDANNNADIIIYPDDRDRLHEILNKDYILTGLENRKQLTVDYRMLVDNIPHYTRMSIIWSSDRNHFIIGVENRDDEVRREKEHIKALDFANELARKDELTGIRNKTAYSELEKELNANIEAKDCVPFAVVVCDINGLKATNDSLGHKAGDELIKASSKLICGIFAHSPVFRIGGDEFVAVLTGDDYVDRSMLILSLQEIVYDKIAENKTPVVASGISDYIPSEDDSVMSVFARADHNMYIEKNLLKEKKGLMKISSDKDRNPVTIPQERRRKIDELFSVLTCISEGNYVFLCDVKHDFSRWSKAAVDLFGLPSEYMYQAGAIWEERIHPDDRKNYRDGIAEIFSGIQLEHDMQYRVRKKDGRYDFCTCRGHLVMDANGEPEYFAGSIRNHGSLGKTDSLTGLRNMYGFFEDLQANIIRNTGMRLTMIGISKFSEINEVYGYHFGNLVLQSFARYLYEYVGNTGISYRLDGTKFAIISMTRNTREILVEYEKFRNYFRKGFMLEGRHIILDLNAGLLNVSQFNVDYQTLYSCLCFSYNESKIRHQGDLVEFYNSVNDENKHRLEKLHIIRGSIMDGYRGFYIMYQPVVDAKEEKLIAAEALIRWKNEEFGVVPPDFFIPILESDPLFPNLGEWILRTSITDSKRIMEKYPDFVVHVNLSYTQLEKADFLDMVLRVLKETGFPANHLCFEITERCRLLDMDLLKNIVINLRGNGIMIALDDFGTGFSSVGLVKDLPFDTIKIDRSFVRKIEVDEKERELLGHFVGLASTFGAKVCVEGVETSGMRDILQQYNVRSFQGYYYAKPLEIEDFMNWNVKKTES